MIAKYGIEDSKSLMYKYSRPNVSYRNQALLFITIMFFIVLIIVNTIIYNLNNWDYFIRICLCIGITIVYTISFMIGCSFIIKTETIFDEEYEIWDANTGVEDKDKDDYAMASRVIIMQPLDNKEKAD